MKLINLDKIKNNEWKIYFYIQKGNVWRILISCFCVTMLWISLRNKEESFEKVQNINSQIKILENQNKERKFLEKQSENFKRKQKMIKESLENFQDLEMFLKYLACEALLLDFEFSVKKQKKISNTKLSSLIVVINAYAQRDYQIVKFLRQLSTQVPGAVLKTSFSIKRISPILSKQDFLKAISKARKEGIKFKNFSTHIESKLILPSSFLEPKKS